MKDYTKDIPSLYISKEERKKITEELILKYKVTNDSNPKIIVYYANGKKVTYNYSKELEESLLINMKETFLKYLELFQICYHEHISQEALYDSVAFGGVCLAAVPLIQKLFSSIIEEPSSPIPFITIGGVTSSFSMFQKIMYMKRYQDHAKTLLYLQKEEDINFHLGYNLNFVNNTMKKNFYKHLVTKTNGKKGYTINSIDKMSLKELQELLSTIENENNMMELFPVLYDDIVTEYLKSKPISSSDCKKRIKKQ